MCIRDRILIDKVAIGNGMTGKYHFKFENYQAFLDVLNGNTGVIMIGAHVGNWEIGAPFFDEYGKKINIVMFDAEHERIKEILEKNASTRDYKIIPVNEDSLPPVSYTHLDVYKRQTQYRATCIRPYH